MRVTQEAPTPCQALRAMAEKLSLLEWEAYPVLEYASHRWDTLTIMYQMRLPKTFEGLLWRSWAADLKANIGCSMVFRSRAQDE